MPEREDKRRSSRGRSSRPKTYHPPNERRRDGGNSRDISSESESESDREFDRRGYRRGDEDSARSEEGVATLDALRARSPATQSTGYHLTNEAPLRAGAMSPASAYREKLSNWYHRRFPVLSKSVTEGSMSTIDHTLTANSTSLDELTGVFSEDEDYLKVKQSVAVMSIAVTSVQLLILMLQLAMCGIATLDVNPMVGPFPDAFSYWGGKNAYLTLEKNQWWRLVSPSFLHVGILHLLANAFCQLEAIALFEREWGSFRWLLIYVVSSAGCQAFANYFEPDTISVGSSGALMGVYAAKLAQVTMATLFELKNSSSDEVIRLDQLSSVLCGLTVVSLLSSFSYMDWSGHMGGLATGYLAGMVIFSYSIRSCCGWFFWSVIGLLGLAACLTALFYFFITQVEPLEELGDPCTYFRGFFPEGYECGCMLW